VPPERTAAFERRTQQLLAYVAVAGAVGWLGTYAVEAHSTLSLATDIYLVVGGWTVLVGVGALLARDTRLVRDAKAWRLWGVVSALALLVNAVANTPQLVPDPGLFRALQDYAYYHSWFLAYAVAYAGTAALEPRSRLVGRRERGVYAAASALSACCLGAVLAVPVPDEHVVLAAALLTSVPAALAVAERRR